MNARELATVLAALRFWQGRHEADGLHPRRVLDCEQVIAREHGPELDAKEIDALCERLNAPAIRCAATPPRIVVEIDGGVCVQVYCDDITATATVLDRDDLKATAPEDTLDEDRESLAELEREISEELFPVL